MSIVLERLIIREIKRQQETLDFIASENIAPREILDIIGSPLTNKYSEGYAGKRYYPGNEYYDEVERLGEMEARKLFKIGDDWSVNLQPYSGAIANLAVYLGLLQPGEKIMGMALNQGGHLSHGQPVSAAGKIFKFIPYGLNEKGFIDYENLEKIALLEKPNMIISGASAYSRIIDFRLIGTTAKKIGAYHLADIAHIAGLVATGLHPSPFLYADIVTFTTQKTLRGPRGGAIIAKKELAEKINKALFPGLQGGPHENIIAAKVLTFQLARKTAFKKYSKQIIKNSKTLAQELTKYGFKVVSGDTDNHMFLVDLKNKNITGLEAEKLLEKAGILANRNAIPGDEKPFNPSGIRFGAPAVTSRGLKEKEMKMVADWVNDILCKKVTPARVLPDVKKLCKKFLY